MFHFPISKEVYSLILFPHSNSICDIEISSCPHSDWHFVIAVINHSVSFVYVFSLINCWQSGPSCVRIGEHGQPCLRLKFVNLFRSHSRFILPLTTKEYFRILLTICSVVNLLSVIYFQCTQKVLNQLSVPTYIPSWNTIHIVSISMNSTWAKNPTIYHWQTLDLTNNQSLSL